MCLIQEHTWECQRLYIIPIWNLDTWIPHKLVICRFPNRREFFVIVDFGLLYLARVIIGIEKKFISLKTQNIVKPMIFHTRIHLHWSADQNILEPMSQHRFLV